MGRFHLWHPRERPGVRRGFQLVHPDLGTRLSIAALHLTSLQHVAKPYAWSFRVTDRISFRAQIVIGTPIFPDRRTTGPGEMLQCVASPAFPTRDPANCPGLAPPGGA